MDWWRRGDGMKLRSRSRGVMAGDRGTSQRRDESSASDIGGRWVKTHMGLEVVGRNSSNVT